MHTFLSCQCDSVANGLFENIIPVVPQICMSNLSLSYSNNYNHVRIKEYMQKERAGAAR